MVKVLSDTSELILILSPVLVLYAVLIAKSESGMNSQEFSETTVSNRKSWTSVSNRNLANTWINHERQGLTKGMFDLVIRTTHKTESNSGDNGEQEKKRWRYGPRSINSDAAHLRSIKMSEQWSDDLGGPVANLRLVKYWTKLEWTSRQQLNKTEPSTFPTSFGLWNPISDHADLSKFECKCPNDKQFKFGREV